MSTDNSLWHFFASVRLALVTISLLAVTSIIGTIIPQNKPIEFYVDSYGPQAAQLFQVLDIVDMYGSWWFVGLILLLCVNLIVCSIDRFPAAWKQVTADGLRWTEERLKSTPHQTGWQIDGPRDTAVHRLLEALQQKGWQPTSKVTDTHTLLFGQKGRWSRTGAYLVHLSILIICFGGFIGSIGGFKGSMVIPESMERDRIALFGKQEFKDLGFTVRCNTFDVDFYETGAPKDYVSSLTIIENGQEVLTTDIRVNHPLTYRGITFYQSSYQGFQEFLVTIEDKAAERRKSFIVPFQQQEQWPDAGLSFGIINARTIGQSIVGAKLWISDGQGEPVSEWLEKGDTLPLTLGGSDYLVQAKQLYATGLQVAKDPGVWWVYGGCALMLAGLYISFFLSHRRVWLLVSDSAPGCSVLLAGSANKNRPGFTRIMSELEQHLRTATVG